MNCDNCGHSEKGVFCGHCGSKMPPPPPRATNAITWPFFQPEWYLSLWMPLAWIIPFGQFLSLGWSVDAIGRRGRKQFQLLPQPGDIIRIFKYGFVIIFFALFYFALPLTIMSWVLGLTWLQTTWTFLIAIWDLFWHKQSQSLISLIITYIIKIVSDSAAPILYMAVAVPMFLTARIRYALTGQLRSFVKLYANLAFCIRHVGNILLYFFLSSVLRIVIILLSSVFLAVPFLGQVLPVALVAMGISIRAYWAGDLAQKMSASESRVRAIQNDLSATTSSKVTR